MMNRLNQQFIKYPSQENGFYDATNNRVHFTAPADNYDLNGSYVLLYSRIDDTNATNTEGAIWDVQPQWNQTIRANEHQEVFNCSIVKNAMMSMTNVGVVHDLRRCDIYNQNLQHYIKSTSELEAQKNKQLSVSVDRHELVNNIFVNKKYQGLDNSTYNRVPVLIKLKDIYPLQSTPSHSMKDGDLKMRLELNLNKFNVAEKVLIFNDNSMLSPCNDVVAGGSPVTLSSLTLKKQIQVFNSGNELPYFVGQRINISGKNNNVDAKTNATIDSINIATDGTVTLTFRDIATPITIASGNTFSDVNLLEAQDGAGNPLVPTGFNFVVEYAELVLLKTSADYPSIKGKVINTYSTEEHTFSSTGNVRRNYDIEPNCNSVFIMPTRADLISEAPRLNRYRLRLNNEDLTDRDVIMGNNSTVAANHTKNPTCLYYNSLLETLTNMGLSFKNYNEQQFILPNDSVANSDRRFENVRRPGTTVIMANTPITNNYKLLQVNMESDAANIDTLVLFKNLAKVM